MQFGGTHSRCLFKRLKENLLVLESANLHGGVSLQWVNAEAVFIAERGLLTACAARMYNAETVCI